MNYRCNIKYWVFVNFPESVLIGCILKHLEVLMGEEDIMHKTFSKKKISMYIVYVTSAMHVQKR